jgi:hypothetical protein
MFVRQRCLIYAVLVAPLAWLFGGVLWRREVLSFRDIAHYYRPLWEWTSSQWAAGRIPLWCPLDGLGMPIHADPTASLFYPGQLVFALPLEFTTRVNLYVIGHLLLAVILLYRTARGFACSRVGAAAGALSYAYGGQVLFQYCNPIYLVGAAWLPLAVLAAHRMLTLRSYRWGVGLAVVLALMVLGGDPQLAAHVALIAALYGLLLWRDARRQNEPRVDLGQSRPALLCAAGGIAFFLAAIQILPAMQWSSRSERAIYDRPRSVWESITFASQVQRGLREPEVSVTRDVVAGLFDTPLAGSHHETAYEFSVGPWRWLELVWPNIGGRMFPQHRRWMNAIPAEGRIWTPSYYMGLLPLLAALSVFSLRRTSDVTTRWFSWLIVLGIVGSLGVYGLGYAWHEIHCGLFGGDPAKPVVGAPVGGLYWLFVTLLPTYAQFRYPAKLMVLASLGLALLAARGWDRLSEGPRWARRTAIALLTLSAAMALCVAFVPQLWAWIAEQVPPEFPFGEFRPQLARFDVLMALLHTAVIAGCLAASTYFSQLRSAWPVVLLLLTAIELPLAQQWMIASSPQEALERPSPVCPQDEAQAVTIFRGEWKNAAHPHQPFRAGFTLERNLAWERESLAERFHLLEGVRKFDSRTGLAPADLAAVIALEGQQGLTLPPTYVSPLTFNIRYRLGPMLDEEGFWDGVSALDRSELQFESQFGLDPVFQIRTLPALQCLTPKALAKQTAAALLPSIRPSPHRTHEIVLELGPGQAPRLPTTQRLSETLVSWTPGLDTDSMSFNVTCFASRLLVVDSAYAPDWIAETISAAGTRTPLTVYRANRLCLSVLLPPGRQTVIFRYRPQMFYVGAVISATAWGLVLFASLRWRWWRKKVVARRRD